MDGNSLKISNTVTAGSSAKPSYNAQGLITGSGSLVAADIPGLDWGKITSGKPTTVSGYGITDAITGAGAGLAKDGSSLKINNAVTAGSSAKPSYSAQGLITGSGSLAAADIPGLDWSKITSGKPTSAEGYGLSASDKMVFDFDNLLLLPGTTTTVVFPSSGAFVQETLKYTSTGKTLAYREASVSGSNITTTQTLYGADGSTILLKTKSVATVGTGISEVMSTA
jgi:hypothetical protein